MSGPRPGSVGTAANGFRAASPLLVIAGSLRAAVDSAADLGLPRRPGRLWQYVSDEHALRGRDRVRVHRGHLAYKHPRIAHIEEFLRIIAFRGEDRVQWIRTESDLLVSLTESEAIERQCRPYLAEALAAPAAAPTAGDVIESIRRAMEALTTKVVVNPNDFDRVSAAAAQLSGPRVEVSESLLVDEGTAYTFPAHGGPLAPIPLPPRPTAPSTTREDPIR